MGVRRNAFCDAGIAEDPKNHGDDVYSEWFLELPVKNRNFHMEERVGFIPAEGVQVNSRGCVSDLPRSGFRD
jgi:hypothetical protein